MNRLTIERRAQILSCLVEGNSIRATSRMTGAAKNTITKLLIDVGEACEEYQYNALRNLPCGRIQVDEIWSFCYSKEKNVPEDKRGEFGYGDVWTWTAICADTKLVPCWLVGGRDAEYANMFIDDLASRMAGRIQLIPGAIVSDSLMDSQIGFGVIQFWHWRAYRCQQLFRFAPITTPASSAGSPNSRDAADRAAGCCRLRRSMTA